MSMEYCGHCGEHIDTDHNVEHFVLAPDGQIVGCVFSGIIDLAKEYARICHQGQKDDEGRDYFKAHIEQVVQILRCVTTHPTILCAAYLHDTIEDTDATEDEIREIFGNTIADLVMEVTHEGTKDAHGHYFPRLHSKNGTMIKFADRLSNMSRMGAWDEKRQKQYIKKSKFWKSEGPKQKSI